MKIKSFYKSSHKQWTYIVARESKEENFGLDLIGLYLCRSSMKFHDVSQNIMELHKVTDEEL